MVSVDKSVSEEFSVSKFPNFIDYVTSTFAPPSTLISQSTTESGLSTEMHSTEANLPVEVSTNPILSSNPSHPFLANKNGDAKPAKPINKHLLFKPRTTKAPSNNNPIKPADTAGADNETGSTETRTDTNDDLEGSKLDANVSQRNETRVSSLQKLLSLRASDAQNKIKGGVDSSDKLKASIKSIKPTLISKRLESRRKLNLSSPLQLRQNKKKLSHLLQKQQSDEELEIIATSQGTTASVQPTISSTKSTLRFRLPTKFTRTSRPQIQASNPTTKRLTSLKNRQKLILKPIKPFDLDTSPTRNRFGGTRRSRLPLRPASNSGSKSDNKSTEPVSNDSLTVENHPEKDSQNIQVTTEKHTVGDIVAGLHGDTIEEPEEFTLVRKFKPKHGSHTRDKLRQRLRDQLAQEKTKNGTDSAKNSEKLENTATEDPSNIAPHQEKLKTIAPSSNNQKRTKLRTRPVGLNTGTARTRKLPSSGRVNNKATRPKSRTRNRPTNVRRPIASRKEKKKDTEGKIRENAILTDQEIIRGLLLNVGNEEKDKPLQSQKADNANSPMDILNELVTSHLDSNEGANTADDIPNLVDSSLIKNPTEDAQPTLKDFLQSAVVESHLESIELPEPADQNEPFLPLAIPHIESNQSSEKNPQLNLAKGRSRSRIKAFGGSRAKLTANSRPQVPVQPRSRLRVRNRSRASSKNVLPTVPATGEQKVGPESTTSLSTTAITRQRSRSRFIGSRSRQRSRNSSISKEIQTNDRGNVNENEGGRDSPVFGTRQPIRQLSTRQKQPSRSRVRVINRNISRKRPTEITKNDESKTNMLDAEESKQETNDLQEKETPRSGGISTGKFQATPTNSTHTLNTQEVENESISTGLKTKEDNQDSKPIHELNDNQKSEDQKNSNIAEHSKITNDGISNQKFHLDSFDSFRPNFQPKFGLRQRNKIRRKLNGFLKQNTTNPVELPKKSKLLRLATNLSFGNTTDENVSDQGSTTLRTSTTTLASVSPANVVTALPAIFFSGTPFGISPNYDTPFGGISSKPNVFGPTPSPLTRIGRSTVDYSGLSDDNVSTEAYSETISGRTVEVDDEKISSDIEANIAPKKSLNASIHQRKLKLKNIKKGGLFGRKRPDFLKTFTNKIAALEKKERALLQSFKGVSNRNAVQVQKSNKKALSTNPKIPPNPILRPRRKLGLKLFQVKDTTTSQPTTDVNTESVIDNSDGSTIIPSTAQHDEDVQLNETIPTPIDIEETGKVATSSPVQSPVTETTFIPTVPPKKRGRIPKFPFSFKGPLKPKLLSFTIEKYKKKKSPHKFSTKVKKQVSDKLKELRGLNKNGTVENTPALHEKTQKHTKGTKETQNDLKQKSTEVETIKEEVEPEDNNVLSRKRLKHNRKSYGSKVNLFNKKGFKKLSFPSLSQSPKTLITTTDPSTSTIPTPFEANHDFKDDNRFESNNKVVFFLFEAVNVCKYLS